MVLLIATLFAEEVTSVSNTTAGAAWTAVLLAIVNGILLTVQMVYSRKREEFKSTLEAKMEYDRSQIELQRERDKRESDSTLIMLKNKTEVLEAAHRRCEEDRARDKTELKAEIQLRDKRYDDILKLILKREEEMEEWAKKQESKTEILDAQVKEVKQIQG
jgi:hypothetical protein